MSERRNYHCAAGVCVCVCSQYTSWCSGTELKTDQITVMSSVYSHFSRCAFFKCRAEANGESLRLFYQSFTWTQMNWLALRGQSFIPES